jgi:hypothetical protein
LLRAFVAADLKYFQFVGYDDEIGNDPLLIVPNTHHYVLRGMRNSTQIKCESLAGFYQIALALTFFI